MQTLLIRIVPAILMCALSASPLFAQADDLATKLQNAREGDPAITLPRTANPSIYFNLDPATGKLRLQLRTIEGADHKSVPLNKTFCINKNELLETLLKRCSAKGNDTKILETTSGILEGEPVLSDRGEPTGSLLLYQDLPVEKEADKDPFAAGLTFIITDFKDPIKGADADEKLWITLVKEGAAFTEQRDPTTNKITNKVENIQGRLLAVDAPLDTTFLLTSYKAGRKQRLTPTKAKELNKAGGDQLKPWSLLPDKDQPLIRFPSQAAPFCQYILYDDVNSVPEKNGVPGKLVYYPLNYSKALELLLMELKEDMAQPVENRRRVMVTGLTNHFYGIDYLTITSAPYVQMQEAVVLDIPTTPETKTGKTEKTEPKSKSKTK